jgi:hypothetical protein
MRVSLLSLVQPAWALWIGSVITPVFEADIVNARRIQSITHGDLVASAAAAADDDDDDDACRDPERTSRILASLMAAAQDASVNGTKPAANSAPAGALNRVASAIGGQMQSAGERGPSTCAQA